MDWIAGETRVLWTVPLTAVAVYGVLIVATRLAGLRSFSKMSSFDFAMTVAIGSVVATAIAGSTTVLEGSLALASIFFLQWLVARWRVAQGSSRHPVDNEPLLLMDGSSMLEENLAAARVTPGDLRAKLRESNVLHCSQVRAVVLETTGDISVLHSSDPDEPFQGDVLLEGVRREARR